MTKSRPSSESAYVAIHERIVELATDKTRHLSVPASPGWRIHDVVAHLSGLCEDWVDHRLDGYASEGWTAAQVRSPRGSLMRGDSRRVGGLPVLVSPPS